MNQKTKVRSKVLRGKKIATQIGFPTANIHLGEVHIDSGIYAGRVFIDDKEYLGALYVGTLDLHILEVHVIGFEGDLYDREIEVEVYEKIRDVLDMDDLTKLREIIFDDIVKIKRILACGV